MPAQESPAQAIAVDTTNVRLASMPQPQPPAADVALLRQRAQALLPDIGRDAAQRKSRRELPFEFARQVANAGLLTFRIPKAYGGPGGSMRDAIRFVQELASVDANLAQALRPNFGLIEGLLAGHDNEADRKR